MRIACVYAPQIALQAVLRRDAELRDAPVALAEAAGERARISALTRAAQRKGVRPGMTACQARTVAAGAGCERLHVLAASAADTASAEAALADVGFGFAPRVQAEGARVFFEVGDMQRLYPEGEQAVAQAIAAQAARIGLVVRVAVAASKGVARVASRAQDIAIVPDGGEAAFLAPLPVRAACGEDGDLVEARLARWGIRTLGALARLPRDAVTLRLGAAGARLWRLAGGFDDEPLVPSLPADAVEESSELDYAIYELEPLAFILRGLIDRTAARLACRGLGCAGLTLRFKLEPRGFEVRQVPVAAPTRESSLLLELTRLELARRPPSAPVVGVALLALPARVEAVQLDFFGNPQRVRFALRPHTPHPTPLASLGLAKPSRDAARPAKPGDYAAGPTPERLASTLARLHALVGTDNVGAPAEVDSFREEAVCVRPLAPPAAPLESALPPGDDVVLAFRRFRPPEEMEVLMGRDGPTALRGRTTTARILLAAGPYRASGEWWAGEGFSRDYWDVHASDGAVYRLHQDRQSGRWFLDGYYD